MNKTIYLISAMRPVHWIKNLALFAALVFTGTLFAKGYFTTVFWAFIAFNFAKTVSLCLFGNTHPFSVLL